MRSSISIFLFLLTNIVYTQSSFSISGDVFDEQNELVFAGDVIVLKESDSTLVKYTSIHEGTFTIEDIPTGKYVLKVTCLGYREEYKNLELTDDVFFKITLSEKNTNLDEVEVIAAKPVLTNENGNIKIDVTNPVFSAIPDPIDLLSRLPDLQVSADRESIMVMGKGAPLIYIGNQRISIDEFRALSVDDIRSIEIIRNPSAKYEASGRAVLLITRKNNEVEGFKAGISETLSFKRNFNNYSSLNSSFKKRRLTLRGNVVYNDLLQWESHTFDFVIPEADIFSEYLILVDKNNRTEFNFDGGLFYQLSDTDYFSASVVRRSQTNTTRIDTDTFLRQGEDENDIVSESDNSNTKNFLSSNLNYNTKLGTKTNVFAGLQYSSYLQELDTEISNSYNGTGFQGFQHRQQRYNIDVWAYRFDLDKTFENGFKWEVGVNLSRAKANARTSIEFLETNTIADINYDYLERTNAAYSVLTGHLNDKVNFNLGLRVEGNIVKGEDEGQNIPLVNRDNTNIFPKAGLTIELDSVKNISFNYAKSIVRPNYSNASSIQVFFNPFLEGEGNVNLLPTLTEELSTVFQYKNRSVAIDYYKRKNPIYYTIGYVRGEDRAVFSLKNLEREWGVEVRVTLPFTSGIWTSSNSLSLSIKNIEDTTGADIISKPYVYAYTDHQFKIAKQTTLTLGGWALTKRSEGIFERNAMLILNASIARTFFDKLDCALRFNDITKNMNFGEGYVINGVRADGIYFVDAQEIAFSMKYSFGGAKKHNFRNKDIDEDLDRIR